MAKLKFNEIELKAEIPRNSLQEDADKAVEDLIKKIKPSITSSLKQSVNSLSHNVTKLSQRLDTKESQLLKQISELRLELKNREKDKVYVTEQVDRYVEKNKEDYSEKLLRLTQQVQKLEVMLDAQTKREIKAPEIKQITVHKNHDAEIKELQKEFNKLPKQVYKKEVKSNKQLYINLALGVGLLVSLVLHVL